MLFATIAAIFLFKSSSELPLGIVGLCAITIERMLTEIYKALIRKENQEKYKIPSDLNIKAPQLAKRLGGFSLILVTGLLFYYIEVPNHINPLILAALAGLGTAIGGMLKDAPHEGFDILKFFRSPMVALVCGVIISTQFPGDINSKYFLLSIFGAERICSEFYKKILNGRLPGKFKETLTVSKKWEKKRKLILPVYTVCILILVTLFVLK